MLDPEGLAKLIYEGIGQKATRMKTYLQWTSARFSLYFIEFITQFDPKSNLVRHATYMYSKADIQPRTSPQQVSGSGTHDTWEPEGDSAQKRWEQEDNFGEIDDRDGRSSLSPFIYRAKPFVAKIVHNLE